MSNDLILQSVKTQQIIDLFDLISGVLFWIKDRDGRVVHCNTVFAEHVGYKSIARVVGKSDLDLFPPYIAKQFMIDDQKIMAGENITNRLEMNLHKTGELIWYTTSKRPLIDEAGKIFGTYGITQNLQEMINTRSGMDKIKKPVEFIKNSFAQDITVEQLADVAHLSVSALERRFKKYLDKTPKMLIREVRLENARRLLIETSFPVAEIAHLSGYTSHSYFSHDFKIMFSILPSKYRQNVFSSNKLNIEIDV